MLLMSTLSWILIGVGVVLNAFYLFGKLTAFTLFASGDIHVNNDATTIVNSGMLLIAGLQMETVA